MRGLTTELSTGCALRELSCVRGIVVATMLLRCDEPIDPRSRLQLTPALFPMADHFLCSAFWAVSLGRDAGLNCAPGTAETKRLRSQALLHAVCRSRWPASLRQLTCIALSIA